MEGIATIISDREKSRSRFEGVSARFYTEKGWPIPLVKWMAISAYRCGQGKRTDSK